MWEDHGGNMGFMWIFWIVIIVAIVFLVKVVADQRDQNKPTDSSLEILKKRYAKGKISKEEFDRLKKDIEEL